MLIFKKIKVRLAKKTVAEILRHTRQRRGWKLTAVAKALNINLSYLQALEVGRYVDLPSGVYGLNFLRAYAEFLNLDYQALKDKFLSEEEIYQSQKQSSLFARQIVPGKYFWSMPLVLRQLLIGLAALVCLAYLGYLLRAIFAPPRLILDSPTADLVTNNPQVLISGQTEPERQVLVNQTPIMVDVAGYFSQTLDLKLGVNEIIITAIKDVKRKTSLRREVLYLP